MSNKLKFTVKCLLENKLRFALTVLSISIGVVSILIVNTVSNFGVSAVSSELDSLGMNGLTVSRESDKASLGDEQLDIINSVNGVVNSAPATVNTSKIYTAASDEDASTMVWGIDEKAPEIITFDLMYGRFINKGDIKSHSKVCIVDQSLARELYGRDNIVGKNISLLCNSTVEDFKVVGVVKTGNNIMQSLMGNYFPSFLYVPYTSFKSSSSYDQIFLKIDGEKNSEAVAAEVEETLEESAGGGESYTVTDLAGQKSVLDSLLNTVTMILTVIGAIALLVSGISIMNIMLISVNERTREIGIKKSIGATNKDIMLDFLIESIIISVIGTVLGAAVTLLIVKIASYVLGTKISASVSAVSATLFFSAALGIVFGIFPAYKASKFKPVESLRR